jgi:serine/threonine protein kinase
MTPTHVDRKTFLANLRRSGLFPRDEIRALRKRLPKTRRGRVLARTLVDWGLLTRFQAELLLAGRTSGFILGQYRILDELGRGGMGQVYKAVHQTMNRVVALKVLAPHLVRTEKARLLFEREVQAVAQLLHPNIVTAYDANRLGDRHYLVMEYVNGPNLEQLVREQGPLPVGLACELIRQVATGLQYATEKGMVHRDIKPSNVLVQVEEKDAHSGFCTAKVLDFGLARVNAGEEEPGVIAPAKGVVMGTPDYLSPEQARGLPEVDIRSDIYSLGCTFYYLLTKKVPFPGGTSLEKLVRHTSQEPTPVEELRPDLPAEVAAVVRRMMAKDPGQRFQTPAEVAQAVAPFALPGLAQLPGKKDNSSGPATPHSVSSSLELLTPLSASGDQDALAATMGVAHSPTPTSTPAFPAFSPPRPTPPRSRLAIALGVAVGIVVGGIGVVGWLLTQ